MLPSGPVPSGWLGILQNSVLIFLCLLRPRGWPPHLYRGRSNRRLAFPQATAVQTACALFVASQIERILHSAKNETVVYGFGVVLRYPIIRLGCAPPQNRRIAVVQRAPSLPR